MGEQKNGVCVDRQTMDDHFQGVLDIIIVQNHTFSYMVDHFKTLKILNYQLKLSGPQLSHLDRPPIFAVYILILQRSRA